MATIFSFAKGQGPSEHAAPFDMPVSASNHKE